MINLTHNKVIIGSLLKSLEKASFYGKIELSEIYLLNVIESVLHDCINSKNYAEVRAVYLHIKNKYPNHICNYKKPLNSVINTIINGPIMKDNLNNNSYTIENNAPTIDDTVIDFTPTKPFLTCGTLNFNINLALSFEEINKEFFAECYYASNDLDFKNLKIHQLPNKGYLTVILNNDLTEELLITENMEILFSDIHVIRYYKITSSVAENENNDIFTFSVSDTDDNYSEIYDANLIRYYKSVNELTKPLNICKEELIKNININAESSKIIEEDFTKCYYSSRNLNYKNLKIIELPTNGLITNENGVAIEEGDTFSLDNIELNYINKNNIDDYLIFQYSDTDDIFSNNIQLNFKKVKNVR